MLVADAISHSPVTMGKDSFHEEIQAHVNKIQSQWQVTDAGLANIGAETLKDVNLKAAMEYTIHHSVVGLSAKRMFSRLLETSSSSELNLAFMMDCY